MFCATKFLIILVLVLRFYLSTLCKYSMIAYYQLITFPCIYLTYVSFMYIYKLLLLVLVLYCQESFYNVPVVIIMTSCISTLVDHWNTK
jgi:hypothetical protein